MKNQTIKKIGVTLVSTMMLFGTMTTFAFAKETTSFEINTIEALKAELKSCENLSN